MEMFGITRDEIPIQEYEVSSVSTGIEYGRVLPGLVPYFEEREAAIATGYAWPSWQLAPQYEKAEAVAFMRLRHYLALNQSDAVNQDAERRRIRQQLSGDD